MKKNFLFIAVLFIAILVAHCSKAQLSTRTRQIRFATVFQATDTAQTAANAGRVWYDFVTGKFRCNIDGVNSDLGGGGAGITTASQGLTKVGSDVRLGGTLTGGTLTQITSTAGNGIYYSMGSGVGTATGELQISPTFVTSEHFDPSSGITSSYTLQGGNATITSGLDHSINVTNTSVNLTGNLNFQGFSGQNVTWSDGLDYYDNWDLQTNTGINIESFAGGSLGMNATQIVLGDNRATKKGIEYAADYSADYTARSLTDKNYVDTRTLEGSAVLNFPSTTSTTVSRLTITVTGAADGDPVAVGVPNSAVTATGTYSAWVSSANTVTVQYSPKATEDPASATFKVTVFKP